MKQIQFSRNACVKGEYDVIIAGGGIAGVSAALAAARNGMNVLLIEKTISLGGLGTIGLISWYEPLCDGNGRKMIGGISEELLRLAIKYGPDDLPEPWKDGEPKESTKRRYCTHYSPTKFILALDDLLISEGVKILFDTVITAPVMDNGLCKGLIVENKNGCEFYASRVVIDCTGDADVASRADIPCVNGENFMSCFYQYANVELAAMAVKNENMLNIRKWGYAGSDLFGSGHPEGMKKFEGVTTEGITDFILTGRKMVLEKVKNDDRFKNDIVALPTMPQFRTIRHIVGEYDLTGNDLFKSFVDSIGAIGDFRKPGDCYEVPYRTLYNKSVDNILAAGRIVSASGDGWEVTRVIPVAALTGQAAGTAAAMCVSQNIRVKDINIALLQNKLENAGVMIHI